MGQPKRLKRKKDGTEKIESGDKKGKIWRRESGPVKEGGGKKVLKATEKIRDSILIGFGVEKRIRMLSTSPNTVYR